MSFSTLMQIPFVSITEWEWAARERPGQITTEPPFVPPFCDKDAFFYTSPGHIHQSMKRSSAEQMPTALLLSLHFFDISLQLWSKSILPMPSSLRLYLLFNIPEIGTLFDHSETFLGRKFILLNRNEVTCVHKPHTATWSPWVLQGRKWWSNYMKVFV